MHWSSVATTAPAHASWRLPSPAPARCTPPAVLSTLPAPLLRLLDAACRALAQLRAEDMSPVVAWPAHALAPSPAVPLSLVAGLLIFLGGITLLVTSVVNMQRNVRAPVRGRAAGFSLPSALAAGFKRIPARIAALWHPLKFLRVRQQLYSSELLRLYDTYKRSVEDFINMTRLCRSLQEQIKDRDARLEHQRSALDALNYDVDGFTTQNEYLRTSKEKLRFDKARLKEQLREERAKHAEVLLSFQRDLESLLKEIEVLEEEKSSLKAKYQEHLKKLQDENTKLQHQLSDATADSSATLVSAPIIPCDHMHQLEALTKRTAAAEAALVAATQERTVLKQQLTEQLNSQDGQTAKHAQQQAAFVDALEHFRKQLVDQQTEHVRMQDVLLQRVEIAKADRSKMKAKLKHARADAETKSADVARLQSALAQHERALTAQHETFTTDLHFVYAESHFERQMYKGALSQSQAESGALRQQLADLFNRYREQATRLDRTEAVEGQLRAALAERRVANDLEDMLAEEVRRRNEEYETLEISFEVLESAYGFLAAETVRLEHALKDALAGRPVSPSLLPRDWDEEDEDEEVEEQQTELELEPEPEEIAIVPADTAHAAVSLPLPTTHIPASVHTPTKPDSKSKSKSPTSANALSLSTSMSTSMSMARTPSTSSAASTSTSSSTRTHDRTRRYADDGTGLRTASSASISSASSVSMFSERSWPATPGLTLDTTSSRSTPSSPVVATPPLSPMYFPGQGRGRGGGGEREMDGAGPCDSPTPYRNPPDLDEFFDSWSAEE